MADQFCWWMIHPFQLRRWDISNRLDPTVVPVLGNKRHHYLGIRSTPPGRKKLMPAQNLVGPCHLVVFALQRLEPFLVRTSRSTSNPLGRALLGALICAKSQRCSQSCSQLNAWPITGTHTPTDAPCPSVPPVPVLPANIFLSCSSLYLSSQDKVVSGKPRAVRKLCNNRHCDYASAKPSHELQRATRPCIEYLVTQLPGE